MMDRPSWPLGLYCERTALGFWAEPLNVWSNLAFVLAAFLAWRIWRAQGGADRASLALIIVMAAIGVGSFAFHAAPSRMTLLMDVIPIQIFVLGAIHVALARYLAWPVWLALLAVAAFFVGSGLVIGRIGATSLGGGIGYLPPLLAMPAIVALMLARAARAPELRLTLRPSAMKILAAAGLFAVSLTLRTLDQPLCPVWPAGLHFLWHGLNAAVLFLLAAAQLRFSRPSPQAA